MNYATIKNYVEIYNYKDIGEIIGNANCNGINGSCATWNQYFYALVNDFDKHDTINEKYSEIKTK